MIILLSVSTHKLLGKDGKEGMLNRGVDIDGTVSKDDAVISSGATTGWVPVWDEAPLVVIS